MHCFPIFLLCLLATQTIGAYTCLQTERDALLDFKAGVSDPFHRLVSWRGEDCCAWAGIKCSNQTGHVVKLNLRNPSNDSSNYSLSGEISPSLQALTDLKHLDLSYNNFSGNTFPKFICQFRNLKYLHLSDTGLSGMIPSQISNLSKLQHLSLTNFDDSTPLSISNMWYLSHLTSLKYLVLEGVHLRDSREWVQALNILPLLQTLVLYDNNLTTIPSSLSTVNFSSLTTLLLVDNNFNSLIPHWIGELTSLTELGLGNFVGPMPLLHNLHNLTSLYLRNININEDITEFVNKLLSSETLEKLQYLGLINNGLTGNLTGWLNKMPNLTSLDLDMNQLNGKIPAAIGNLTNLKSLYLPDNSFTGKISEIHLTGLSKLEYLDLSSNSITIEVPANWVPSFQLGELGLGACKLGPRFPSWLQNQTQLSFLNLSNTEIIDSLPDWFWNLSALSYIDLSHNQIRGRLPLSLDHFTQLTMLILSNNQFIGAIPSLPHSLLILDLSSNSFSGPLPPKNETPSLEILILLNNFFNDSISEYTCGFTSLQILDLSNNNLNGDLPHCWPSILQFANLANNEINGTIPSSMSNLSALLVLQLNNNYLTGELPSSLQLCKSLSIIDLGENQLSGQIPKWLGEMSNLAVLQLRSNLFWGSIPSQIVHLSKLHMLDLSNNNISGLIPQNLDKLIAMALPDQNGLSNSVSSNLLSDYSGYYNVIINVSINVSMKDSEREYSTTLPLLTSIDLSGNNLRGEIPPSLTVLHGLINLNLSNNHLNGAIPIEIGNMQSLESLDLRKNELSGIIPQSLANLDFLDTLNLSYNNLSGEIPKGDHLETLFDPYTYIGNAYLCGSFLNKSCNVNETSHDDIVQNDDNDSDEILLYLIAVIGFGFGFWLFFGVLMFKRNWRYHFFQMVDDMFDIIYVFVVLYVARLRRDAAR